MKSQNCEDDPLPTMVFLLNAQRRLLRPTVFPLVLMNIFPIASSCYGRHLQDTNPLAGAHELPDARINDKGLNILLLEDDTPPEAKLLKSQTYGLLPHVKITDLLLEGPPTDQFHGYFTHLKSAERRRIRRCC